MEAKAVLKYKEVPNAGGTLWYAGTSTSQDSKGRKKLTVNTTDKVENAVVFQSFGLAGLASQKAEMNMMFYPILLCEAAISEVARLREIMELTSKN